MEEEKKEKERKFIREKILPRKHYKRIVGMILAITLSLIVFGAAIGVSYYLARKYLGVSEETQVETIVIARDEATETAAETETEAETEKETEAETEAAETEPAPEETTEAEITISDIYEQVKDGLVTITYRKNGEDTLFGTAVVDERTGFGVCAAESKENYFILTDLGNAVEEDSEILVNGVSASVQQMDNLNNMLILKVDKEAASLTPVKLGNSFLTQTADRIFMFGAPYNQLISMTEGAITLIETRKDVIDGYEENIYTDMYMEKGGHAAIFNEAGEMIGWISEYSSDEADVIAVANGISGLKYLIEDMCSGQNTAYIGVYGTGISEEDAEPQGIPTGYYVKSVQEESPAFLAGIQVGDCLAHINGLEVKDSRGLEIILDALKPGQTVDVEVMRYDAEGYMPLTLSVEVGGR